MAVVLMLASAEPPGKAAPDAAAVVVEAMAEAEEAAAVGAAGIPEGMAEPLEKSN